MVFKILFLVSFLAVAYAATNYCDSSICPSSSHIACGNNGAWGSKCPANAKMVDLTPLKQQIVARHNEKRNQLAGGKLPGYKPAKNMATIQWSDELASIAALNVKRCVMQHDKCRNTADFKYSGQNLAIFGYSGPESGYSDSYVINNGIDSWWDEHKDANQSFMDAYPSNYKGPAIGHFTVMAAARNIAVGCATSRYNDGTYNWVLTACNYATTNIIGWPLYESGAAASGCSTGTNRLYPSLCSTSETYDRLK